MLPLSTHAPLPSGSPGELVSAYHERTKHRLAKYAAGPETLDWDAQPAPFRHFAGSSQLELSLLDALPAEHPCARAFASPWSKAAAATPWSVSALGALLQTSLGITAWKRYGPDRWAVRANPSSGNLHPVEAYVVARGVEGLLDGVHHYLPDRHALEQRAHWPHGNAPTGLFIALSSIMWREAWKYGERAFRYCQLDVGHAVGALAYAAAALGWEVREERYVASDALAALLGLQADARVTEREEPELLLRIEGPGLASEWQAPSVETATAFEGAPSIIDRHPIYQWPIVDQIARATRHPGRSPGLGSLSARAVHPCPRPALPSVGNVLLQRRSAQRFDVHYVMEKPDFLWLLESVMPAAAAPWLALSQPPHIDLIAFVIRVRDLEPGIYLLERRAESAALGVLPPPQRALGETCAGLRLSLLRGLSERSLMQLTRTLHCHQDIASSGCFALGMLADFEACLASGPSAYRDLLREAGLIGQALYVNAEALGLRGTGIGCYFDDSVHEVLGLAGKTFQSVYHFTVGKPIDDPRIELSPAYPERHKP